MEEIDRAGLSQSRRVEGYNLTGKRKEEQVSDYRSFGLWVGGAFCALSGLFYWWGFPTGFKVPATIGGLLLITGLLWPISLKYVYRGWMKFAFAAAWFNTRLILSLMFYLVMTPVAALLKLFGKKPLAIGWDKQASSYWIRREKVPFDPTRYEKHF